MATTTRPSNKPAIDAYPESQITERAGKERYGAGDTFLVQDVLPPDVLEGSFERLCNEVKWNTMSHRGGEVPRLVAVEGTVDEDGTVPIYRHPADESPPLHPFSPTVDFIREHVSRLLPSTHAPLNHVLIQRYRTGEDYISEHADKTIDVIHGTYIVNVSLGAQRRMTLRTKKPHKYNNKHADEDASATTDRTVQRIPLPHNSAFFLGLTTNRLWLHSIRQDRRAPFLLTPPELAFGRERISLTFRSIGTFLTPAPRPPPIQVQQNAKEQAEENENIEEHEEQKGNTENWLIWGQGATSKSRLTARSISSNGSERAALIRAFGVENHSPEFDWKRAYGRGFDVLHFTS
ncbi:uncharacterized protein FOMMEDRAFT_31217 [Fomitiporia mediterranea MF3/22]|uniref:uncharacterized protein n=1 Tax=Fomitiporia mediterranea (strain MF3/22) TaxID=694068 RepID=UPI0004407AC4|nr:uncharacterized protein FOMMEDRAFT_31217 [Fomitiporia mediterranea MF3/22]EJC99556.1 hypothetical protein FOMMEDRAFT_31217 [Fomitiporia mediterranea MF3/22]